MIASSKNSPPGEITSAALRPTLPPLKALLAFEFACRHGSFTQAADELGVTRTAISHQIQKLEDFLGVQLFIRQAGRAVMTKAGRRYAAEIENAFGIITNATNLVAPQSQRGHLIIASGPSFAAKWLQPRISQFINENPSVGVRLSTISDFGDLETIRFDLAISYGCPPSNTNHVEPLLIERLRPLCSPDLAERLILRTPSDLVRATLIHSVNALTWAEYFRHVQISAFKARHELWFDRSTMAIDAAVSGLGVVLESEILAANELLDGRLISPFNSPEHEVETTSYYLVRSPESKSRPQVAAFESWMSSAIATANLRAPPQSAKRGSER